MFIFCLWTMVPNVCCSVSALITPISYINALHHHESVRVPQISVCPKYLRPVHYVSNGKALCASPLLHGLHRSTFSLPMCAT